MSQTRQFSMRLTPQDRRAIQAVARYMKRSQAGAIKAVFGELYSDLKANQSQPGQDVFKQAVTVVTRASDQAGELQTG